MSKFKSINDFTPEECMEYIASHSDDDPLTIEVKNRLNFLQENRQPDIVPPPAPPVPSLLDKTNEFCVKFNRYYITGRYEEAFAVCLKYIPYFDDKKMVLDKTNSVIPKLTDGFLLPSSIPVSYNWLIDCFALKSTNNKNLKLEYDGNSLICGGIIRVEISSCGKLYRITTKCNLNLFLRFFYSSFAVLVLRGIAKLTVDYLLDEDKKNRKTLFYEKD